MGVRSESAASEAWLTEPPIWPMMRSAEAPFWVGIVLNTRTRSLPPSAMKSRLAAASAKRGKLTVALQAAGYVRWLLTSVPLDTGHRTGVCIGGTVVSVGLIEYALLGIELTRSGWPTATSAACPLVVGIEFQMTTRL